MESGGMEMKSKILILLILLPLGAFAQEKYLEVNAQVQNVGVFKTDSDFDDTKPYYNPSGQTVGFFGTFFRPAITLNVKDIINIYYEIEVGLNIWSRNSLEQLYGETKDTLSLKHRQIYAEGKLSKNLSFRMGYQYFKEPTGLFINHWLGGMRFGVENDFIPLDIFIGQFPDQTYEGWEIDRNNFTQDRFVFSVSGTKKIGEWNFEPGIVWFYDGVYVRKQMWLLTPVLSMNRKEKEWEAGIDIVFEGGRTNHGAYDGDDETHAGGALQVYYLNGLAMEGFGTAVGGKVVPGMTEKNGYKFGWGVSLLLLSPDDHLYHNGTNFGVFYSGRSRSPTLILTEDELRDRGDNLDERSGEKGTFYLMRAGLAILDGSVYYKVTDKIMLSGIAGNAFVLNKRNALGGVYFGTEFDVVLRWMLSSHIVFDLVNSAFVPGKAASAFVNDIDKEKQIPQYMLEASLNAFF